MTRFVFSEAFYELVLFGLLPLFLTVGTVRILWHVSEKINPDEITDIRSFLIFIVVVTYLAARTKKNNGPLIAAVPIRPQNGQSERGWPTNDRVKA